MCARSQLPRVWTFLELMQYFNVCHLVRALDLIEDSVNRCVRVIEGSMGIARDQPVPKDVTDHIGPSLMYLRAKCLECELSNATQRIDQKFVTGLHRGITFGELIHQFSELKRDIDNDLEYRRFVFIPSSGAHVLDGLGGRWGAIWKVVPPSEKDTRDAALSYAVGLHTAVVVHAMRVAEFGLRYLAKKMKVKVSDKGKTIPVEFATWEKIITNCNNRITEARKLPTNAKRDSLLRYYASAADHCGYMKEIWRNEASHARKTYIEPEARAALDRVHAFMEFLSAGSK
jgi:hypothetical protein